MNATGIGKLLSDVLASQDEDGRGGDLTEERVVDVLLGGGTFSAAEERLLAASPLARNTYAEVFDDLQMERDAYQQRCELAGIRNSTRFLLAAAGGQYPLVIPSDDFSVTVRAHPTRDGWVITLALGERFRRVTRAEDVVVLVDDQGVTWVRGQINTYGEIHSYNWPYDESPTDRMREPGFALRVIHG